MPRSAYVLTGTALGLLGIAFFRTTPVTLSPPPSVTTTSSSSTSTTSPRTPPTTVPGTPPTVPPTIPPTTVPPTTVPAGPRSATGQLTDYSWGTLSVKVTLAGGRITSVTVPSLNDYGNGRSQYIDDYSIPILEQEALRAQSANIASVSGASYTSAGFIQSLQEALSALGR